MKKNMGNTDRLIRLTIAAILFILAFRQIVTGAWNIVFVIVAGIFVVTSLIGYCPLYSLFGIKTGRSKLK